MVPAAVRKRLAMRTAPQQRDDVTRGSAQKVQQGKAVRARGTAPGRSTAPRGGGPDRQGSSAPRAGGRRASPSSPVSSARKERPGLDQAQSRVRGAGRAVGHGVAQERPGPAEGDRALALDPGAPGAPRSPRTRASRRHPDVVQPVPVPASARVTVARSSVSEAPMPPTASSASGDRHMPVPRGPPTPRFAPRQLPPCGCPPSRSGRTRLARTEPSGWPRRVGLQRVRALGHSASKRRAARADAVVGVEHDQRLAGREGRGRRGAKPRGPLARWPSSRSARTPRGSGHLGGGVGAAIRHHLDPHTPARVVLAGEVVEQPRDHPASSCGGHQHAELPPPRTRSAGAGSASPTAPPRSGTPPTEDPPLQPAPRARGPATRLRVRPRPTRVGAARRWLAGGSRGIGAVGVDRWP